MIKRLLLAAIAVATLASTVYTLTLLDQIVHGTLYSYGLSFSYNWANPYWTLFRATMVLLMISATVTILNTILVFKSNLAGKMQDVKVAPAQKVMRDIPVTTQFKERTPTASTASSPQTSQEPTPTEVPAPSYMSPSIPELLKCMHCGKTFTQPLRMLDFQKDPPQIMNVCPFCNETVQLTTAKESEQIEFRSVSKQNNNHVQKSLTH